MTNSNVNNNLLPGFCGNSAARGDTWRFQVQQIVQQDSRYNDEAVSTILLCSSSDSVHKSRPLASHSWRTFGSLH